MVWMQNVTCWDSKGKSTAVAKNRQRAFDFGTTAMSFAHSSIPANLWITLWVTFSPGMKVIDLKRFFAKGC
jgi:hypothetical protein